MKKENESKINPKLKLISKRLIELRVKKGYTSYENFAFDNEISRMQYWRMESGNYNYTLNSLLRVIEIHQITLDEFFKGIES